ncbi:MAG: hypothetical protein O7G32_09270 [SAR324 cluster bacterium]|nr:hypothetical protein [SAR324 cluster bacterium]
MSRHDAIFALPWHLPRLLLALALLAALSLTPWGPPTDAGAVEFATPPGINIERQEAQIKEEVTRNAKDLVGDNLVSVVVHVGYARTEPRDPRGRSPNKIKLPGFNRFITSDAQNRIELKPEFVRMRQIFVIVSENIQGDLKAIEKELISLGDFERRKGDNLRVLTVSGATAVEEGKRAQKEEKSQKEEKPKNGAKEEKPQNGKKTVLLPPISEPKSTVHLLRARTAYFNENYNRALDHILKAISVEPNNAQAYAMLGSLYFTINWKNLAIKYWEKSLEIDPENRELEDLVAEIKNQQ